MYGLQATKSPSFVMGVCPMHHSSRLSLISALSGAGLSCSVHTKRVCWQAQTAPSMSEASLGLAAVSSSNAGSSYSVSLCDLTCECPMGRFGICKHLSALSIKLEFVDSMRQAWAAEIVASSQQNSGREPLMKVLGAPAEQLFECAGIAHGRSILLNAMRCICECVDFAQNGRCSHLLAAAELLGRQHQGMAAALREALPPAPAAAIPVVLPTRAELPLASGTAACSDPADGRQQEVQRYAALYNPSMQPPKQGRTCAAGSELPAPTLMEEVKGLAALIGKATCNLPPAALQVGNRISNSVTHALCSLSRGAMNISHFDTCHVFNYWVIYCTSTVLSPF